MTDRNKQRHNDKEKKIERRQNERQTDSRQRQRQRASSDRLRHIEAHMKIGRRNGRRIITDRHE